MTPIKIQIPDDAWREWPDEPGWYFIGRPGNTPKVLFETHRKHPRHITVHGSQLLPDEVKRYRFARISLPKVPEAKR